MNETRPGMFYEYSYRNRKMNKTRKLKMLLGYLLFAVIYFAVFSVIFRDGFIFMIPLLIVLPLIIAGVALFTWKYTMVEYEIQLESETLRFSEVYGGRDRRKKLEFSVRDAIEISPFTADDSERIEALGCDKNFLFLSSLESPMLCTAVIKGEDKKPWVIYFDVTVEMIHRLRKINPTVTKRLTELLPDKQYKNNFTEEIK